MNHSTKLLSLLFLIAISVTSQSFITGKEGFEYRKLKKDMDTVTLKQTIATIRGIDNNSFIASEFEGHDKQQVKFRLLSPGQSASKPLPLIVVFHGSGSIGNDNKSQLGLLAKLLALPENQLKYPAYVLAPQFSERSSNYVTDSNRKVLCSVPQPGLMTVLELIDSLKTHLDIDPRRIYVIGFSMGASTVINAMSLRPDLFAAGVGISGIPQFNKKATLANKPIWLIHGNADTENPINSDRQFYKEMSAYKKMRFWEFENTGHNDIFSQSILGNQIPEWLFHQSLSK